MGKMDMMFTPEGGLTALLYFCLPTTRAIATHSRSDPREKKALSAAAFTNGKELRIFGSNYGEEYFSAGLDGLAAACVCTTDFQRLATPFCQTSPRNSRRTRIGKI